MLLVWVLIVQNVQNQLVYRTWIFSLAGGGRFQNGNSQWPVVHWCFFEIIITLLQLDMKCGGRWNNSGPRWPWIISTIVTIYYSTNLNKEPLVHLFWTSMQLTGDNKKLITRWDSERELSLGRHRARTTKYNRLVHKFRHRSTRLCVGMHAFTKFSEITAITSFKVIQGRRFWYQS